MSNGDDHEIRNMPDSDVMDLVEDFQEMVVGRGPILTLLYGELGNNDVLHLARVHISSIQVEGS
jgi:hypothetical protein